MRHSHLVGIAKIKIVTTDITVITVTLRPGITRDGYHVPSDNRVFGTFQL